MGIVGWLFAIVPLIWVFNIDRSLQDLKLCVYFVGSRVYVRVYLCFPIKAGFLIDLFRVNLTLIMQKRKKGDDGELYLSLCVFVSHKGRE